MGTYRDLSRRINFMHNNPAADLTPFQVEQVVEFIKTLPKPERAELVGLLHDCYLVIPSPRTWGRSFMRRAAT